MAATPKATPITQRSRYVFYLLISKAYGKASCCDLGHFAAFDTSLTLLLFWKRTGSTTMNNALKFISWMTNNLFERQMSRAASRISAREHLFWHQAA
jgi:hypothetical protein